MNTHDLSEERFTKLFAEAPLGIALIDSLTGHICEVNPMYARIVGRTMEEVRHIDWMSITHPDDVQGDLDNMALVNAGKTNGFEMEKRYLRPDGTVVWIHMTIARVKAEDAASPRHLCMVKDITERKRAEAQIREQLDELRRWQALMLGREERTMAVKSEVNELLRRLGEPIRYPSVEEGRGPAA